MTIRRAGLPRVIEFSFDLIHANGFEAGERLQAGSMETTNNPDVKSRFNAFTERTRLPGYQYIVDSITPREKQTYEHKSQ